MAAFASCTKLLEASGIYFCTLLSYLEMTPDLPFYVFPNSVLNIFIVQLWTDLKGLDFAAV